MKHTRAELPTRPEAGGACIQAKDWGYLNVARIRFPKGADATPLPAGMPQNLCLPQTSRHAYFFTRNDQGAKPENGGIPCG